MKKVFSLVICFLLLLNLCACGSSSKASETPNVSTRGADTPLSAAQNYANAIRAKDISLFNKYALVTTTDSFAKEFINMMYLDQKEYDLNWDDNWNSLAYFQQSQLKDAQTAIYNDYLIMQEELLGYKNAIISSFDPYKITNVCIVSINLSEINSPDKDTFAFRTFVCCQIETRWFVFDILYGDNLINLMDSLRDGHH